MISLSLQIGSFFLQVMDLFRNLSPGYLDIVKIFAGTIGWIGGLTLFMWLREKKRQGLAPARLSDKRNMI